MVSADGRTAAEHRMGPDIAGGERPQAVVPAKAWQAAESLGAWTLCGCTVAPAFRFEGFEMAPPAWAPGPRGAPGGRCRSERMQTAFAYIGTAVAEIGTEERRLGKKG